MALRNLDLKLGSAKGVRTKMKSFVSSSNKTKQVKEKVRKLFRKGSLVQMTNNQNYHKRL